MKKKCGSLIFLYTFFLLICDKDKKRLIDEKIVAFRLVVLDGRQVFKTLRQRSAEIYPFKTVLSLPWVSLVKNFVFFGTSAVKLNGNILTFAAKYGMMCSS